MGWPAGTRPPGCSRGVRGSAFVTTVVPATSPLSTSLGSATPRKGLGFASLGKPSARAALLRNERGDPALTPVFDAGVVECGHESGSWQLSGAREMGSAQLTSQSPR